MKNITELDKILLIRMSSFVIMDEEDKAGWRLIRKIPHNAFVVSNSDLFPALSNRTKLYKIGSFDFLAETQTQIRSSLENIIYFMVFVMKKQIILKLSSKPKS